MSDVMKGQPFDYLVQWIVEELERNNSVFGIDRSLFFVPQESDPFSEENLFGQYLATPIGPAAGPHTQMAQNIVSAWLCGGRFIELKTVQVMDELDIPRPCIDMEDEGYNVEWSQELKLEESVSEYVKAWALVHVLRRILGFDKQVPFGTIFNMSVGYDLKGIQTPRMTEFMDHLNDASDELSEISEVLAECFGGRFGDIDIPSRLINNATVSTMHGCPPGEIEQIASYLMEKRGLHTMVKLNPTLLGKDRVMRILHDDLGFTDITIPDKIFSDDLQYEQGVELIKSLKKTADNCGLTFNVKLSNTLPTANHKENLPGDEMYMSGRPLYPITMNLFARLYEQFDGDIGVSFCAGVDALNVLDVLASGAFPVTAASDLLKPGGYGRFGQYLEKIKNGMRKRNVESLCELAKDADKNLDIAAKSALTNRRYNRSYHRYSQPKIDSELTRFDCITAPCVAECPVGQDVPEYARLISEGQYDRALEVILSTNPLPGITGYICTHICQTKCTRNDYDEPVAIRALKRFADEHSNLEFIANELVTNTNNVAIVGSGPSGLATAFFLGLSGIRVTVFESEENPGGIPAIAPGFRLPPRIVQKDIDRIRALGVDFRLSCPIASPPERLLEEGFDAVYVANGFPRDLRPQIEGTNGEGVYGALELLKRVSSGKKPRLGSKVVVIGGGNTAVDSARTAQRLTSHPATVLYRRTRAEMPAEAEEIDGLLEEGNQLKELVSPKRIVIEDTSAIGVECVCNRLGEIGSDGRREPIEIEGSEFFVQADTIILAIGQAPDVSLFDGSSINLNRDKTVAVEPSTGVTNVETVYAGGDTVRSPETIIQACADGRRAAEAICAQLDIEFKSLDVEIECLQETEIVNVKQARSCKQEQHRPERLPVSQRTGFQVIEQTLTKNEARQEAQRCLQCSSICDKCVEVCPNRANYSCLVTPIDIAIPIIACKDGKVEIVRQTRFNIEQNQQIIHIDDLCNECGNCATFCVHQGKPYTKKTTLVLQLRDFQAGKEDAMHISGNTVRRREGGSESTLALETDRMIYENDKIAVTMSPDFEVTNAELKKTFSGDVSLRQAIEMAIIAEAVSTSMPFLVCDFA